MQHAAPGVCHALCDAREFRFACRQRWRWLTIACAMVKCAGGRKPDGTRADCFGCQCSHLANVLLRSGLPVRAALSHDIDAQRGMGQLGADVSIKLSI